MGYRRILCTCLFFLCLAISPTAGAEVRDIVILYTNDFHSAIDPIPAYWLDREPTPHLGGAAEIMTLVEQIRKREAEAGRPVFLFDTGPATTRAGPRGNVSSSSALEGLRW